MLPAVLRAAQTNMVSAPPEPVSNRYLIIIETSRSMMKRGDGVLETLTSMILNGMKGQMRGGDTLGIWTYNDKLHVGEFPLQIWTPANRQNVAQNAENFLKHQKFENKSRLSVVLPPLRDLIKESEFITVLILSSAREKISGTPFDQEINAAYATWAPEQEKKLMPVVTVLRATKGTITHQAVVPVPQTWEMPPLSPELIAAWNTAKKQVEALTATNKPAGPPRQPLIVKGKKPEPAKNLPATTLEPGVSNTPSIRATQAEPRATSGTNGIKAAPAIATPLKPTATNQTTATNPGARAATEAKPNAPGETAKTQLATTAIAPAVTPGQERTAASTLQPAQSPPKAAPDKPTVKTPDQPTPEAPGKVAKSEEPALTPQPAALVPGPTIWENGWFWTGIGVVMLSGAAAAYAMIRRSRPASRVSLITSSLDRTNKP